VRIVFLGTPVVAVPALEALVDAGHEVGLVVSQPDRPVGRSRTPRPPAVKVSARALGLAVHQPRRVRDDAFRDCLEAVRPDVLVVVAYGRILPAAVLQSTRLGAINVHFSLLPSYRGAAPVQWALARGEQETGVTTMQMSEGLDEGDVLGTVSLAVARDEHAPALAGRLAVVGARLLVTTLVQAATGSLVPHPQDDARATFAPRLTRADGEIDPALSAREIEGRIRGFDPWPGVWLAREGRRIRLVSGHAEREIRETAGPRPGEIVVEGGRVFMGCGGGTRLRIDAIQPEGRRVLAARDAVNGRQLVAGDRLRGARGAG